MFKTICKKWNGFSLLKKAITSLVIPIFIGWIGTYTYGQVFPAPDEKLLSGQKITHENQDLIIETISNEIGDNTKYTKTKWREKLLKADRQRIEDLVQSISVIDNTAKERIVKLYKEKKYKETRVEINNIIKKHFLSLSQKDIKAVRAVKYRIDINYKNPFASPYGIPLLQSKIGGGYSWGDGSDVMKGDVLGFQIHIYANGTNLKNIKSHFSDLTGVIVDGSRNIISHIEADNIDREYGIITIKSSNKVKLVFNHSYLQVNECQAPDCSLAIDSIDEYILDELHNNGERINAIFTYKVIAVDDEKVNF